MYSQRSFYPIEIDLVYNTDVTSDQYFNSNDPLFPFDRILFIENNFFCSKTNINV